MPTWEEVQQTVPWKEALKQEAKRAIGYWFGPYVSANAAENLRKEIADTVNYLITKSNGLLPKPVSIQANVGIDGKARPVVLIHYNDEWINLLEELQEEDGELGIRYDLFESEGNRLVASDYVYVKNPATRGEAAAMAFDLIQAHDKRCKVGEHTIVLDEYDGVLQNLPDSSFVAAAPSSFKFVTFKYEVYNAEHALTVDTGTVTVVTTELGLPNNSHLMALAKQDASVAVHTALCRKNASACDSTIKIGDLIWEGFTPPQLKGWVCNYSVLDSNENRVDGGVVYIEEISEDLAKVAATFWATKSNSSYSLGRKIVIDKVIAKDMAAPTLGFSPVRSLVNL